jgi:hypothetical protein
VAGARDIGIAEARQQFSVVLKPRVGCRGGCVSVIRAEPDTIYDLACHAVNLFSGLRDESPENGILSNSAGNFREFVFLEAIEERIFSETEILWLIWRLLQPRAAGVLNAHPIRE